MGDIQLQNAFQVELWCKDKFHDTFIHPCLWISNPLPPNSYTREGRIQIPGETKDKQECIQQQFQSMDRTWHIGDLCTSTNCQVWYKETVDQMIWFIGLDQALHEHPGWTETRLYTQGNNGSRKVPKPMAGHFPVGNGSMAHSVGEPHNFTTGKYFHGCVNYLFYEDRIGFIGIIFVLFFCLCVWKGSIRDETHLELKILMRLEICLWDPPKLATWSQKVIMKYAKMTQYALLFMEWILNWDCEQIEWRAWLNSDLRTSDSDWRMT